MPSLRLRLWLASGLLLACVTGALQAQSVNTDKAGVAAGGYDVVAYHSQQRAIPGLAAHFASHQGATYRFATKEHRDRFVADPGRWLPQYGGYCAYGVSRGYKVKVDPKAFTLVEGKLYLNYSMGVRKDWLEDTGGYITRADANWPGLVDAPRR